MVDHTVMTKLREFEREFTDQGIALAIVGLGEHVTFSPHPAAARIRGLARGSDSLPTPMHH